MQKPAQIIEKALIRAFPGQSEAAKTVYRFEFASWLKEALTELARTVMRNHFIDPGDKSFRDFQRTYAASLGRRDSLLTWSEQQMFSAARGWNWSGQGDDAPLITVQSSATECTVAGVVNSMIVANELLLAPAVTPAQPIASNYIEFVWDSNKPVALSLFPPSVTPTTSYEDVNSLLTVLIEEPGQLSVYRQGASLLNPDNAVQLAKGYRVRAVFASDGAITVKVFSEADVEMGSYPLLVWLTEDQIQGTPYTITASVMPVLQFGDDGAQVKNVRIGVLDTRSVALPRDYPLVLESLFRLGGVQFEGGRPLAWAGSSATAFLPRITGQWYYTLENNVIRIFPAIPSETAMPPSKRLLITACVVLKCEDLAPEYDAILIEMLAAIARERAGARKVTK